jgi:hypothetical protein
VDALKARVACERFFRGRDDAWAHGSSVRDSAAQRGGGIEPAQRSLRRCIRPQESNLENSRRLVVSSSVRRRWRSDAG